MTSLESLGKSYLPPSVARFAKKITVYLRYWIQRRACRRGFTRLGDRYAQTMLFVAGLPKSGTTWLKKMLVSYPGFHEILIPEVTAYELTHLGSHDYELPDDTVSRFEEMLAVTKMHIHGSLHNAQVLHKSGVKYVVLYRDLRDVAVSHYFYVKQTPWHPEYASYMSLSLQEGLALFGVRLLPDFADWVRAWDANRDPSRSLMVKYEDMLADTFGMMTRIAEHFDLDSSPETVQKIVDTHSFKRLSGGRKQGQESRNSFFRKGRAGDWKNHLTPEITAMYKEAVGEFLIEYGYEQDYDW